MGTHDQSRSGSIEHGYLSEKIERALTRQLRDVPQTEAVTWSLPEKISFFNILCYEVLTNQSLNLIVLMLAGLSSYSQLFTPAVHLLNQNLADSPLLIVTII